MVFWLRPHHNWRPLRKADRSPGGSNQMTPTVQCSSAQFRDKSPRNVACQHNNALEKRLFMQFYQPQNTTQITEAVPLAFISICSMTFQLQHFLSF